MGDEEEIHELHTRMNMTSLGSTNQQPVAVSALGVGGGGENGGVVNGNSATGDKNAAAAASQLNYVNSGMNQLCTFEAFQKSPFLGDLEIKTNVVLSF